MLVALVASVPALAWIGWRNALEADGQITAAAEADPTAPGYRAVVTPTPTLLVVHRGPDGQLGGIAMLASSGESGGGAVLLVPTGLLADQAANRPRTLRAVYADEGVAGVEKALNRLFRLGFGATVTADARDWVAAAASDAPFRIDNPDELLGPDGEVAFGAGPLELSAEQVEQYLRLANPGEDERAQLYRAQLLWQSWTATEPVGAAPVSGDTAAAATPGGTEPTASLGAMVADLRRDRVEVLTVPVTLADADTLARLDDAARFGVTANTVTTAAGARTSPSVASNRSLSLVFVADEAAVRTLVASLVPFPTSAQPGDRIRVRLLDGLGDPGQAINLASVLVPAGAEIIVFGNADNFQYATTVVEYFDQTQSRNAQAMATALGLASATFSPTGDGSVDVSITVGRDMANSQVPAKVTMPSVVPASGG
ncbi:MAG: LytR C-terminal domain-containing protein [Acidimicrobiales bacterium]